MKRDTNSKGRETRVTSGSGKVYRRGQGLNTGKPIGKSDGYSRRKQSEARRKAGSGLSGSSQSPGNSGSGLSGLFGSSARRYARKGMGLKRLLIIVAVIIIGFFVLRLIFGSSSCSGPAFEVPAVAPAVEQQIAEPDLPLNTSVSDEARDKRTTIIGNGQDVHTIMIYMCGTDLESRQGMATSDLNEILHANISDKVNIIVETGGTRAWKNNVISSRTNQRYQCTSEGLVLLEDNLGIKAMTDPNTLTDFISYCKSNFSANRYSLIFWDHGGGSAKGFGYDEHVPNTTMTLDEINTALKNANCEFDFIGFDACLMATYETAIMLDRYSDYLIASEETEPGIGWYYTDWISALSENTSMSTPEIGKNIIDSFIQKCYQNSPRDKTTLSIVDLAELSGTVPKAFKSFAASTGSLIDSDDYKIVSDARSGTREFGQPNKLDQIDLIHLAQNINTPESNELVDVLKQSIKYNRTSNTIANANGLSIYFPFGKLSSLGSMLTTYEEIGMDEEYSDCIRSFANLEAGGQVVTSGTENPLGSLLGSFSDSGSPSSGGGIDLIGGLLGSFIQGGDFGSITGPVTEGATQWLDPNALTASTEYYEQNYLDSANIVLSEKNGGYVLSLSDKEWDLVQNLNLNVFFDDGSGFIDLGLDNVYEFDADGDLKMVFDSTWIAINGQNVSYYFISEDRNGDDYTITGRVPAMLNDQLVDLILVFDDENPYGEVLGARLVYQDEAETVPKGLIEIEYGDVIDFICDYYTYDEDFIDSFLLGDQLIVNGPLEISNVSVGYATCKVTYQLTDIYNNTYWTPALTYKKN